VDAAAWGALLEQARAAAARGDTTAALAALDAAIALDSLAAGAYYAKGRLLDAARRFREARAAYLAAKDRDALPFRAPEAMNRIVREEAARAGATVVETQAALAAASPGGIIGKELMLEHLHPNVDGYFRLADTFYEALRAEGLIGAWTQAVPAEAARAEVLLTAVDSLVGVLRVRQLMGSWPFQPPGVVVRDPFRPSGPVEEIALALFREEVGWVEANERLRVYYMQRGDVHRALQAALVQIQEYPFLASSYLAAGNLLVVQRRYSEAETYFRAANDLGETALAHRMIGSLLLQRGDRTAALPHLERAVALDPQDATALYNLAGAYALAHEYEKAREAVGRLLRLQPGHAEGRRLLGSLPPPPSG
jgi:tetratricopeptide (TPR) repeat protein